MQAKAKRSKGKSNHAQAADDAVVTAAGQGTRRGRGRNHECVSVGLTLIIAWLWFTPRSRAQHSLVQPAVAGATQ